jgi:hypothetical protein
VSHETRSFEITSGVVCGVAAVTALVLVIREKTGGHAGLPLDLGPRVGRGSSGITLGGAW